jgi:hypothetical protein
MPPANPLCAKNMSRVTIPGELRRAVIVEAGHRCAIPRCGCTDIDVHHIIPWEICKKHEYVNLIALCPNCHRRAHKGEIDRKSLREYKARLAADFSASDSGFFPSPAIEIKRRISDNKPHEPARGFDFEFPDFRDPTSRVISRNIEALGNELFIDYQSEISRFIEEPNDNRNPIVWLRGRYDVVRKDSFVISLKYCIERYSYLAAHRSSETRVQNFAVKPFIPITIEELLVSGEGLERISSIVRSCLAKQYPYFDSDDHVLRGTAPISANFALFNIGEYGLNFIFEEYQITCYAMGRQDVWIDFDSLQSVIKPDIYALITQHDGL